ncbi:MAG: class I SAM-dependent methyltransferase [Candidatus Omnitrophica bacterium]|nr:class I SAM-dependent methyltransferase [Candidatus Omnitrophota bacterium]MBU1870110.1 class I SAM-dependent methyltransferase [Candidatus Omnitrophota bacterium]
MSKNYSGRIDPDSEEWKSTKWADLLKERYYLASLFTENKVVLDSCCGTGFGTVNLIAPVAKFTVGVDLCESAMKDYGKSDNYEFLVMDGRSLKFDADTFNIVLSLDAIEHFKRADGLTYLSEIKRVCSQEGLIIGTTPLVAEDSLIPVFLEWNKFHYCMYTREDLHRTLAGIFPAVRIFEIYSRACPYFLFLCGKSKESIADRHLQIIEEYISDNERNFIKGKISSYFLWGKVLIKKMRLLEGARFLFSSASLILKGFLRCR